MTQLDLFRSIAIPDSERLYIIGNGFDIHHGIESQYGDFKKWVLKQQMSSLVDLMDTFFSNEKEFWCDIEQALGDYDEQSITSFCEPLNPPDFQYDHPGHWQAGIEDGISYTFDPAMERFRDAFDDWVNSIDLNNVKTDLLLPQTAKYLSFNYTETLEKAYSIPLEQVLHIHGFRLTSNGGFIIGHGNPQNPNSPLADESVSLPYQNAYSSVIATMNKWTKDTGALISKNKVFFDSLSNCKGVCVMGLSYNDIDLPYLLEVEKRVSPNANWVLCYHSEGDKQKAIEMVSKKLHISNYCLEFF